MSDFLSFYSHILSTAAGKRFEDLSHALRIINHDTMHSFICLNERHKDSTKRLSFMNHVIMLNRKVSASRSSFGGQNVYGSFALEIRFRRILEITTL